MISREELINKKLFRYRMIARGSKRLNFRVSILGVGELFGDNCLMGEKKRFFSATAVTDCIILCSVKHSLTNLLDMYPDVKEYLIKRSKDKKLYRLDILQHQLTN